MKQKPLLSKSVLFICLGIIEKTPGLSGGEMRFFKIASFFEKGGYRINLLGSEGLRYLAEKFKINYKFHAVRQLPTSRLGFILKALTAILIPTSLLNYSGVVYSTSEQVYEVLPGLVLKMLRRDKVKWAVVAHWMPPLKFWERRRATLTNSLLFLISERLGLYLAYLFADRLLCVSASTRNQLASAGMKSGKIHVVECGIDFQKIRKIVRGVKIKKYQGIFIKRLQAVKGVLDLPIIWKKVVESYPRAKIAVVGGGLDMPDGRMAVVMAEDEGLEKNIDFLGPIYEDKAKFTLLAESSVFILPTYEENWAIVIGEALAAGTPVVAYSLKELREVWLDSIIYTPLGDKKAMAERIMELLKSPKELQYLSVKGIEFVRRYTWDRIAENELEIIIKSK
ncbi:glycosyltransferase family 4 protein [Candidatus Gottesmanbacteria bacterium]|nr:glycosyltransferase family 4 protein [Candidatus Gottesmanbacteria bacterium]